MAFQYKKTQYENLFEWHSSSNAKCFYCNDKEGAPLALQFFRDEERGICTSCLENFEVGHLGVDRHVIQLIHPTFSNHEEARSWFKEQAEKGGCQMFMVGSTSLAFDNENKDKISYAYNFVHDIETYRRTQQELKEKGATSGFDSIECYNRLEIHSDGSIHIVY